MVTLRHKVCDGRLLLQDCKGCSGQRSKATHTACARLLMMLAFQQEAKASLTEYEWPVSKLPQKHMLDVLTLHDARRPVAFQDTVVLLTCWPASSYAGMLACSSRFCTILDRAWFSAFLCLLPISYSYSGVLGLNRGPCSARTLASASVCSMHTRYDR